MSFAAATALTPTSDVTFTGQIASGWDIVGNANGGYLLATAARAAVEVTGKPDVVTVTGHFLRPGRPGPISLAAEPVRIGRRHGTARVSVSDSGGDLLVALATTTDLAAASGPERVESAPPELPDPPDCIPIVSAPPFPPPFMDQVELRLHPHDAGFAEGRKTGDPRVRGWFRLPEGEPLTTLALVLATDAFPPTIFNADLPIAWTPTVELTAHVRSCPPSDGRSWLRCEFTTRFITGGYLEADGELWDEAGKLVAQSRQLALIPTGDPA